MAELDRSICPWRNSRPIEGRDHNRRENGEILEREEKRREE